MTSNDKPDITEDVRLRIVREICAREGHGDQIAITTYADMPFDRRMCKRGCGAEMYHEYRGPVDAKHVAALLAKLANRKATITRFEIIVEAAA